MRPALSLVLLVILLPVAAGVPLFPLSAQLQSPEPLEVHGAVVASPAGLAASYAWVHNLGDPGSGTTPTLLTGDEAYFEVLCATTTFTLEPPPDPRNLARCALPSVPPMPPKVTRPVLTLTSLRSLPQISLDQAEATGKPPMRVNATGASCRVSIPDPQDSITFPADSAYPYPPDTRTPHSGQLVAACGADAVVIDHPGQVFYYGMNLHLSAVEGTWDFQTGTNEEPAAPGAPVSRTVTQFLKATYSKGAFQAMIPLRSEVRVFASEFAAVGRLSAGPSEGYLQWGGTNRTGTVDPFASTGGFLFSGRSGPGIGIEGNTLDAPSGSWGIPKAATVPAPVLVTLLVAAGVGLAAAVVRALWALFSKLAPDRLLDHPRRRRIYEYVRQDPGAEISTIARQLNLRWSKVVYHVTHLQRGGQLVIRRIGGRTAIFQANVGFRGLEARVVILRRSTPRGIYEILQREPGLDQENLSRRLNLKRSSVSKGLRLLVAAGLVRTEQSGRRSNYFCVPANGDAHLPEVPTPRGYEPTAV